MSACRFCAEALPPSSTKCPSCGERHQTRAELRWERDHVLVLTPGELPLGVCFGCAAVCATLPRRVQGRRDAPVSLLDVPTCAACSRRLRSLPSIVLGCICAAMLTVPVTLRVLEGRDVGPLAVGWVMFLALVVVALALIAHHLNRTRVRVRWTARGVSLHLPDAEAVRRAVERDGI